MISGNSHYCVTEALGSEEKITRRTCNKIRFQMLVCGYPTKLSFSARQAPRNHTQRRTCTLSSYANVEVENIHWKEVSAAAQNIQTLNQFRGFAVGLSIEQCIIIFFLRSCFTGSRKVLTRFGMSHYGADTTFHFYLSIRELLVAKQLCLWWHHSLHALLCILSFQLTHRIASWRRNEQLRGNIEILLTQQAFRPCIVHSGTWKRDDSGETMNTFALAVAPF